MIDIFFIDVSWFDKMEWWFIILIIGLTFAFCLYQEYDEKKRSSLKTDFKTSEKSI